MGEGTGKQGKVRGERQKKSGREGRRWRIVGEKVARSKGGRASCRKARNDERDRERKVGGGQGEREIIKENTAATLVGGRELAYFKGS